jgi:hypothetical protein
MRGVQGLVTPLSTDSSRVSAIAIMPAAAGIAKDFCSKARNIATQISYLPVSGWVRRKDFV